MNIQGAIAFLLFISIVSLSAEEMDSELTNLAKNLAVQIKEKAKKKVTVIDFTDLQGRTSELGRYVAEQLTVDLVLEKQDFSVLDRANLKSILAEHKLTATGLIDPANAKKLGMFSGVDALIIGTVIPKKQSVSLTARIITTDTAEVVGAAKSEFKTDETVLDLLASATAAASSSDSDGPNIVKSFGDLRVEIEPLRVVNEHNMLVTINFVNGSKKPLWVALKRYLGTLNGALFNQTGDQYSCYTGSVSGISTSTSDEAQINEATELPPSASITATLKFGSVYKKINPGFWRLQLELLTSKNFNGERGDSVVHNLVTKVELKQK